MMKKTPTRFIVLDIETDVPFPKQLVDDCKPFLIGTKSYSVAKDGLRPEPYRYFERKHFVKALESLCKESVPIVGYNLPGFDYVVLHDLVNVEPLFRRTVDLLEFLARQVGSRRGLKLNKVCQELFGEGKLMEDARGLAQMWEEGNREAVLRYNERDCDLTAKLWLRLRMSRSVTIQEHKIEMNRACREFLDGRRPVTTYREWRAEGFVAQSHQVRIDHFEGIEVNPIDLAKDYDRYVCKKMGTVLFARLIPRPLGEDDTRFRPLFCPVCGEYVWHSPYVFQLLDSSKSLVHFEKLWATIKHYVSKEDLGHLLVEHIPCRQNLKVGFFGEEALEFDEAELALWIDRLKRDRSLAKFIPKFEERVSHITKRGLRALEKEFGEL